jgi:LysM repeat protein
MQKNFKLILSIILVLLSGALAFGQEKEEKQNQTTYKEVTLDGKAARLNVVTGEITFVNPNDKKEPITLDEYDALSKKKAARIASSNANSSSTSSSDSSSQPIIHTVKEGETLLKIAIRYGATLTELKRANNMESTLVKKGQKLRVSNLDAVETQSEVLSPSQSTYVNNFSDAAIHIVEKGQTLYSLAKRYGTTVSELKQYNGLNSNLIIIGQKLSLPNANVETSNGENEVTSWRVVDGDTLYSISKYTGTSVDELKRINGLINNIIIVGQQIDFKSKSATAKK